MKRFFILSVYILVSVTAFSQVVNNLVVFSNEGLKFTLIMNGERYNNTPETKVRVTGLTLKKYQVKIIFEDTKMKDVNTTLTFFRSGYECQFALNKYGSKKHKMEYFTETVMEGFEKKENPPINSNNQSNPNDNSNTSINTVPAETLTPAAPSTLITGPGTLPNNSTNGNIGIILANEQFNIFKSEILKQVSDAAKHAKAVEILKKNSLLCSQVKETMSLFSTDQAKLDFAKKAYSNTKDKENYSQLIDALSVNSLKDDLRNFIDSKK